MISLRYLKLEFEDLQAANPYLGDTIILGKLVKGKNLSEEIIQKLYQKLVTERYGKIIKEDLMRFYQTL